MNSTYAIVIPSCDHYEDVWFPFFTLFLRYWPDCPYPIYLITNEKLYHSSKVKCITTGKDIDWSTNMIKAIQQIPETHFLVLMDDYLLNSPVDTSLIEKFFQWVSQNNANFLQIFPCRPTEPHSMPVIMSFPPVNIIEILPEDHPRNSLQAGIWKKEIFSSLIQKGESPWQFEEVGTKRADKIPHGFYSCSTSKLSNLPLTYPYFTGIIKGYWEWETISLCKKENIEIDFTKRKREPLNIWFFRRTRIKDKIRIFFLRFNRLLKKIRKWIWKI